MEKNKKIYFIAIMLLIIVGGSIYIYYNQTHVSVGETSFNIPKGFSTTNDKMIGITNGTMSIFFNDTNETDLNKTVSDYVNLKAGQNTSVQITKLQIKDYDVYKSSVANSNSTLHYWFIKNGKTYEICTWTGNQNTDILISEIL